MHVTSMHYVFRMVRMLVSELYGERFVQEPGGHSWALPGGEGERGPS